MHCTGDRRLPACSPLIRKFFPRRFGKRVLPALAPVPPAYYGGDADDEAALLEELLEEAGLE